MMCLLVSFSEDKYSGLNMRELIIHSVEASDAGVYTLRAKNRDALSSLNVTLLVNRKLFFLR